MIDVQELRKAYKRVRIDLGLSMGEAAKLLDIAVSILSSIENGKPQPIKRDIYKTITTKCHICGKNFTTHPIVYEDGCVVFGAYICPSCEAKK